MAGRRTASDYVAAGWQLLIGRPLPRSRVAEEQITPVEGLSALSLDALTSVAYGPEAIIFVLAVAGAGALHLVLPITIAIVALLAILVFSYRQVIDAYPIGGGAYAVSRANFGAHASLVAAAALVVDYTLTVAVSIAAGVGVAARPPSRALPGATVPLCLGILPFITVLNLRGLGEAARAFLLPTLLFIVGLLAIIAIGLIHPLGLERAPTRHSQCRPPVSKAVSVLLVLKAFSAGCSALTGVEAIANGVPLFQEPRAVRAKRTELLLGLILGAMLLGLAVLANRWQIGPRSGQTVLSQIMAMAVGRGWAYYIVSLTITVVLALAANTSFGGLARPGQPAWRGTTTCPTSSPCAATGRSSSNGIWVLAVMAGVLLIAVGGNTNTLIPLFAIGVFTGFTLSQSRPGRALAPDAGHRAGGAGRPSTASARCITAIATIVFLFTKFTEGAWVVVVAVPLFILLFLRIHAYYQRAGQHPRTRADPAPARAASDTSVIVPVNRRLPPDRAGAERGRVPRPGGHRGVRSSSERATRPTRRNASCEREWAQWDPGVPLRVLRTDYASVVEPIVAFIDSERQRHRRPDRRADSRRRSRQVSATGILHNQIDLVLSQALKSRTDLVVARAKMPLDVHAQPKPSGREPDQQPAPQRPT